MRALRRVSYVVLAGVGLYFAAALAMTAWPAPTFRAAVPDIPPSPLPTAADVGATARRFRMADGVELNALVFDGERPLTLVFVHGMMSSSSAQGAALRELSHRLRARVVAVDLRGHGASEGVAGDVPHVGQYAEDIAEVVRTLRAEGPQRALVLGGVSMGGGVALRHALLPDAPRVDGYLLLAPHLGARASTTRTAPARGAPAVEAPMKVHIPRLLGLAMLDAVCLTFLHGLDTLYVNAPVRWPLRRYTFRALVSGAPEDHRVPLAADTRPMLVLVGADDEAFVASNYARELRVRPSAEVRVFDGVNHAGILRAPAALESASAWLDRIAPSP
ncbi:MAG: lysophospholipase [Myxococcaceae bacterium]|nr:lysophospholipase [Myxococcaceae bacterium]MCI0673414.1 lysophospholipase [Myxococcaceae bacterium]